MNNMEKTAAIAWEARNRGASYAKLVPQLSDAEIRRIYDIYETVVLGREKKPRKETPVKSVKKKRREV